MCGIQAERTVSEPRMRMSASCGELPAAAICLRKSGRCGAISWLNVGSGSVGISAVSATSALSATGCAADLAESAESAECAEVVIEIPASFAF